MDKETAKAIRAWIKAAKKEMSSSTDYARGFREACRYFGEVINAAEAGDLEKLKDL